MTTSVKGHYNFYSLLFWPLAIIFFVVFHGYYLKESCHLEQRGVKEWSQPGIINPSYSMLPILLFIAKYKTYCTTGCSLNNFSKDSLRHKSFKGFFLAKKVKRGFPSGQTWLCLQAVVGVNIVVFSYNAAEYGKATWSSNNHFSILHKAACHFIHVYFNVNLSHGKHNPSVRLKTILTFLFSLLTD